MNLAYKKILGKFTKVLGFGKTPPPCWEKFPNNIVFFFESVPNWKGAVIGLQYHYHDLTSASQGKEQKRNVGQNGL